MFLLEISRHFHIVDYDWDDGFCVCVYVMRLQQWQQQKKNHSSRFVCIIFSDKREATFRKCIFFSPRLSLYFRFVMKTNFHFRTKTNSRWFILDVYRHTIRQTKCLCIYTQRPNDSEKERNVKKKKWKCRKQASEWERNFV